ncbi:MAG TPA: hypothetical protein VIF09_10525 [Polyangiaceae bacterium]|jgi:hypothetical protein
MGVVSLIVMEPGSEWPGHVGDTENIVAAGCGRAALLQRTRHMVDAMRARGQFARVAVLACGEQADLESARCRAEIAGELLQAIAPVPFGRLFLCTGDRPSLRLRHELLSLAGALCHELRGRTSAVAVRFGSSSDRSRDTEHSARIGAFTAVTPSLDRWLAS